MNLQRYVFISLFSWLCSVNCGIENKRASVMREYFKLTGNYSTKPFHTLEIDCSDYINFLKDYYVADPISCLEEVYEMNNVHFEAMFFEILTVKYIQYYIRFPRSNKIYTAVTSLKLIEVMIRKILFKPFCSSDDMEKKFSIIRLLIKFLKRYLNTYLHPQSYADCDDTLELIKAWEHVMTFFPSISSNGIIDYDYFFTIFHSLRTTKYTKMDIQDSVLLETVIHHLIVLKDIKLFDISHPYLPFLACLILGKVDDMGNLRFNHKGYHPSSFANHVKSLFEDKTKFSSFTDILISTWKIVVAAKKKLGTNTRSRSYLAQCLEVALQKPLDEENLNIMWQLNGLAVIEKFLKIQKAALKPQINK